MKKQALIIFATLCVLAALTATPAAYAQSGVSVGKGNIPFDFTIRDRTLPAGRYTVELVSGAGSEILLIRGADGRARLMFLPLPAQSGRASARGRLVFRRYGERYFLAQIWMQGKKDGYELSKSSTERSLERELSGRAPAGNALAKNEPELVTIALAADGR